MRRANCDPYSNENQPAPEDNAQMAELELREPGGEDFAGGEFLLAEQRPRRQSKATVVPLGQGGAVVFAVSERPVRGTRGFYRTRMKHSVSTVRSGARFTLGLNENWVLMDKRWEAYKSHVH